MNSSIRKPSYSSTHDCISPEIAAAPLSENGTVTLSAARGDLGTHWLRTEGPQPKPEASAQRAQTADGLMPDVIAGLQGRIGDLENRLAEAQDDARAHERTCRELSARLEAQTGEMAALTRLLLDAERDAVVARDVVRAIFHSFVRYGRRRVFGSLILWRIRLALRRSRTLDEDWYLAQNGDVANSRIGAAKHFLLFGFAEKRLPKEVRPVDIGKSLMLKKVL